MATRFAYAPTIPEFLGGRSWPDRVSRADVLRIVRELSSVSVRDGRIDGNLARLAAALEKDAGHRRRASNERFFIFENLVASRTTLNVGGQLTREVAIYELNGERRVRQVDYDCGHVTRDFENTGVDGRAFLADYEREAANAT